MVFYHKPAGLLAHSLGLLLDSYAPQRCLFCDQSSYRSEPLCDSCRKAFTPNSNACPVCALPECAGAPCPDCQLRPAPLRIVAPWVYDRAMAYLLRRWKYDGERRLVAAAALLAMELPPTVGDAAADPAQTPEPAGPAEPPAALQAGGPGALALPTPLHWRRRLQRGFNQSEDLLHAVRRRCPDLAPACNNAPGVRLRRRRATARQALAARSERLHNLRGAFHVEGKISGRAVLLIDDVCTTGATGAAMATVLRDAGAAAVTLWCLARTPER